MEQVVTLDNQKMIRISDELQKKIEALAAEEQRNFSQMARILLEQGLEKRTMPKGKKQ